MIDYSFGGAWTASPNDVADAAAKLGVLASVSGTDGPPEHREVLVAAHDGTWPVHRDRESVLGWVAARLDPHGWPVPGTLGWLGAPDLPATAVVRALLDSTELPTDLHGVEPPVPTAHPMRQDHPARTYLRCPRCAFVAQPDSTDCVLGPDGSVDLGSHVIARCGVCDHDLPDARGYAVPRDRTGHKCPRCEYVTDAPACAARVRCAECGLHHVGRGLSADDRDALFQTERARNKALRDSWNNARP